MLQRTRPLATLSLRYQLTSSSALVTSHLAVPPVSDLVIQRCHSCSSCRHGQISPWLQPAISCFIITQYSLFSWYNHETSASYEVPSSLLGQSVPYQQATVPNYTGSPVRCHQHQQEIWRLVVVINVLIMPMLLRLSATVVALNCLGFDPAQFPTSFLFFISLQVQSPFLTKWI